MVKSPTSKAAVPATPDALWRSGIVAILAEAGEALGNARLPVARRVQKARQATKAARALLRLAPLGVKRKALGVRMILGSARRLLSQARDTDALLEALNQLGPDLKLPKGQMTAIRALIRHRQTGFHATLPEDIDRTLALFRRAQELVEGLKLPRRTGEALVRGIADDYRKLRRESRAAFAGDDIEALHDLRKRVVVHRHHCAFLAGPLAAKPWGKRTEIAKALHEALGNHRDLALLDDFLRPQQNPKLTPAIARILRAIEQQHDALLKDADRLARKLLHIKPARLEEKVAKLISR